MNTILMTFGSKIKCEMNSDIIIYSYIGTNLIYNELEYYSYLNSYDWINNNIDNVKIN